VPAGRRGFFYLITWSIWISVPAQQMRFPIDG
jgi:hypothetical protein